MPRRTGDRLSASKRSGEYDEVEYDVVIVGGGPAGCSAGIFTARYGLDTVVLDRGRSSIRRCAHLENYLGFPAGVDVETLYDLMHDHAGEAGCVIVPDLVESVEQPTEEEFTVVTRADQRFTTRRVIAATRYDGEYLRPLVGDAAFETHEYHGETRQHFDRSYPGSDGRTSVPGLYVASPADETDRQAIVAAGRGARVGLAVVEDVRLERGLPESIATCYDWLRREAELTEEWRDRDRWREWFDDRLPAEPGLDADRLADLREREIDRRFDTYLPDDEIARRTEHGQRRLLEHIDDELIVEAATAIETAPRSAEGRD